RHREQGLPIRCPTPNRYLPDAAQEAAEHTDEQLLFDKERRPPRQHSEDQLRLDQRTVVGHEHDGTGTRHPFQPSHPHQIRGTIQPPCHETAEVVQPRNRAGWQRPRPDRPCHRRVPATSPQSRPLSSANSVSFAVTSSRARSEVSNSTASSAARSGEFALVESSRSRRSTEAFVSSGVETRPAAASWALRRLARTSADAVRNTFSGASGTTTVPMSLPSTTIPPTSSRAFRMMRRCSAASISRTSGTADTAETAWLTSSVRIASLTSTPSKLALGSLGSVPTPISIRRTSSTTADASSGPIPARSTANVATRYMAPVSR